MLQNETKVMAYSNITTAVTSIINNIAKPVEHIRYNASVHFRITHNNQFIFKFAYIKLDNKFEN